MKSFLLRVHNFLLGPNGIVDRWGPTPKRRNATKTVYDVGKRHYSDTGGPNIMVWTGSEPVTPSRQRSQNGHICNKPQIVTAQV